MIKKLISKGPTILLLLLIPSLSWGKPVFLECMDSEYPDSSLSRNIVSFDLDTGKLTAFDNKISYLIYQANDAEILAQELNTNAPSFIHISRITGEMMFISDTINVYYDCAVAQKKF